MKIINTNSKSEILKSMLGKLLFLANGAMVGLLLGMVLQPSWQEEQAVLTSTGLQGQQSVRIEEGQKEEKICYLTFDDGPSKKTEEILDILQEHNAKATFFVIGNSLTEENRPILERLIKEGHAVGLHANNHSYEEFYATEESWKEDWIQLKERLEKEYGITTTLFRFPGGSACTYMKGRVQEHIGWMHEQGFTCFDWNVSGEDAVGTPTVYSIYKNVIQGAAKYNTPIVLLHDSNVSQKTVEALPEILKELTNRGYGYETLEKRKEYIFRNSR